MAGLVGDHADPGNTCSAGAPECSLSVVIEDLHLVAGAVVVRTGPVSPG